MTHPVLLAGLAGAGHGSKVLIADGNYPLSTATHPGAVRVHLNLRAGLLNATTVLEAITDTVPVEAVHVMTPGETEEEPAIFAEFRALVPGIDLTLLGRQQFYDMARSVDLAVAVATGESRLFANTILTIGVVK